MLLLRLFGTFLSFVALALVGKFSPLIFPEFILLFNVCVMSSIFVKFGFDILINKIASNESQEIILVLLNNMIVSFFFLLLIGSVFLSFLAPALTLVFFSIACIAFLNGLGAAYYKAEMPHTAVFLSSIAFPLLIVCVVVISPEITASHYIFYPAIIGATAGAVFHFSKNLKNFKHLKFSTPFSARLGAIDSLYSGSVILLLNESKDLADIEIVTFNFAFRVVSVYVTLLGAISSAQLPVFSRFFHNYGTKASIANYKTYILRNFLLHIFLAIFCLLVFFVTSKFFLHEVEVTLSNAWTLCGLLFLFIAGLLGPVIGFAFTLGLHKYNFYAFFYGVITLFFLVPFVSSGDVLFFVFCGWFLSVRLFIFWHLILGFK